ncbi:MAG: shikimate dehydrogenase [Syntrophorhabdaceae bacterium]|nr:shikimate dehydrogenase [Syntrophorhabdaceae bacterium]
MMIKGTTKLLGVVGYPIGHSLSPVMHNAAIEHLKADYVYVPFSVRPEDLAAALRGFEAMGVKGFSVTIPHKQTIMPLLTEVAPEARLAGAVNAVWRTQSGWKGTNYDSFGFVAPLKAMDRDWKAVTPVILGIGGAARSVVVGCHSLGCPEVHVLGRNPDKLAAFAESWRNTPVQQVLRVHSWDELEGMIPRAGLIINATPMGMHPKVDQMPVSEEMIGKILPGTIVYDLIYAPRPTLFLDKAKRNGAIIVDGLEMLVQQGAKALEIWLDQAVPIDIMREALLGQSTPGAGGRGS